MEELVLQISSPRLRDGDLLTKPRYPDLGGEALFSVYAHFPFPEMSSLLMHPEYGASVASEDDKSNMVRRPQGGFYLHPGL